MNYLSVKDIVDLHQEQIELHGGVPGVRDNNLLESAVKQIQQNIFGQELYPTLSDKVARLGFCIARNHIFNDANKRTSLYAMVVMLEYNEVNVDFDYMTTDDCLIFMVDLAAGKKSEADVVEWIENKLILND